MTRPIVLIAEELSPATLDVLGDGVEIRHVDGTDRDALLHAVAEADALIVRSATQVDTEVFDAAPQLTAVARAGVGLDNVDVDAATRAGVMVINAPTSNITSAAELAVALILASMRNLGKADASVKAGRWERSALTGTELLGKNVGIVGFGRIGQLVAERLRPFGVQLLAFDPYVNPSRAAELGTRVVDLKTLMREADVITVHMPKTPETTGLIGEAELALAKPSVHVINAARGGLIDEEALHAALINGQIHAAALDVYTSEPPQSSATASALLELPNVTLTPHLGASTVEAQEKAGVAVAKSVLLALQGEMVPDAVNVAGGPLDKDVRVGIGLTDRLGQLLAALHPERSQRIEIHVRGEIAHHNVDALKLSALRGVFRGVSEHVSYVNAPLMARERGIDVELVRDTTSDRFRNSIEIHAVRADGVSTVVAGTLSGVHQEQKLIRINQFEFDTELSHNHLLIRYADRPGMIGRFGTILGESGINIAGMQVSRPGESGSEALVLLTLDDVVPPALAEHIKNTIDALECLPIALV